MSESLIDIVIVNYNTRDLLLQCLNSIRVHTPEPHKIFVVDNGSKDGSVQAVARLGWHNLTLIRNARNLGYARACNKGILAGTSPYIVLLNSDVMALPGWLPPIIECFQSDPRIAVVGPKLVDLQGRITGAGFVGTNANHHPRGLLEPDGPGKYDQQEDCIGVCGAAYFIRRDLLPVLGLFDENYFFYFEEVDYSFQAQSKGYRNVYCPKSKMVHIMGQSCSNQGLLNRYFRRSRAYFQKKWKARGLL